MRSHYWTCSRLADWIRGTTKLKCGTSEEWHEWEDRAKAAYPVRWWLAEEGLDYIQKFVYYIPDKLNEVRYWSMEFSLGEQQLIAFARIIIVEPKWVFLDEATSALDEETEAHIASL
jgi:putative ATP-binding cassette transporter